MISNDIMQDKRGVPLWIRPPKAGVDHYCGLSRTRLYSLAAEGKIRSVSIRKPGQVRGTRLFELQSILDFIGSCDTGQKGSAR